MQRPAHPSILPAERQRRILDALRGDGGVTVEGLVQLLGVSESTVRRDLEQLSEKGLLSRTHGGAVPPAFSTAFESSYIEKKMQYPEEKERIGAEAAKRVADGETLILDSGSTTFEVGRHLASIKRLKIITYDLLIAGEIDYDPSTSIILAGGVFRRGFNLVVGGETENFFRNIRVNKAFLGVDSLDPEQGIFNATLEEASIKKIIIEVAREVIVVTDHSKFGRTALAKVCALEHVHEIITGRELESTYQEKLRAAGVNLTLV